MIFSFFHTQNALNKTQFIRLRGIYLEKNEENESKY